MIENDYSEFIVESDNAIYLKPLLLYKDCSHRISHQKRTKNRYPTFKGYSLIDVCTLNEMRKYIVYIFAKQNQDMIRWVDEEYLKFEANSGYIKKIFAPKPIVLLAGEPIGHSRNGLSRNYYTFVILMTNDGQIKCWEKDSRMVDQLTLHRLMISYLVSIDCPVLQIIPSLAVSTNNCLLECLRFAANLLDGTFKVDNFKQFPQLTYYPVENRFAPARVQRESNGGTICGPVDLKLIGKLRRYIISQTDTYKKWSAIRKRASNKGKMTAIERTAIRKIVEKAKKNYNMNRDLKRSTLKRKLALVRIRTRAKQMCDAVMDDYKSTSLQEV